MPRKDSLVPTKPVLWPLYTGRPVPNSCSGGQGLVFYIFIKISHFKLRESVLDSIKSKQTEFTVTYGNVFEETWWNPSSSLESLCYIWCKGACEGEVKTITSPPASSTAVFPESMATTYLPHKFLCLPSSSVISEETSWKKGRELELDSPVCYIQLLLFEWRKVGRNWMAKASREFSFCRGSLWCWKADGGLTTSYSSWSPNPGVGLVSRWVWRGYGKAQLCCADLLLVQGQLGQSYLRNFCWRSNVG